MAVLGIFLHWYPEAALQSRGNVAADTARRLFCPQPDWFKLRVATLQNSAAVPEELPTQFLLKYFAVVKVKTVWRDILTYLTEEEFWGLEFFHFPTDFFSLEVIDFYALKVPVKAPEAVSRTLRRQPNGLVQVARPEAFVSSSLLTKPNELFSTGRNFHLMEVVKLKAGNQFDGQSQTIQDVLRSFDIKIEDWRPVSVPVVEPLYHLLAQRSWGCIPCLGRWLNLARLLLPELQSNLGTLGSSMPDGRNGKLSIPAFRNLMMQIQSWAPKILQACADEEELLDLKCQFHSALAWILDVMVNLPRKDKAAISKKKEIYSSVFLVRTMLATRLIPSYVCMKQVATEVIGMLFPTLMDQPLEALLQSKHLFPSDSSKHAMRLFLDSALLLWRRDEEANHEFIRFGGADSSPQHGNNWLLSSNFFIDKKHVVHAFRCLHRMIEESDGRSSGVLFDEQSLQSKQDHLDIISMLRREHDLPVALGHQAESTAHKCAAMLHKFAMRLDVNERLPRLRAFTSTFFSFCSDMGVEIGVGDFRIDDGDLEPLLPSWLVGGDLLSDLPRDACLFSDFPMDSNTMSFNLESDLANDTPVAIESDLPLPAAHPDIPPQCQNIFFPKALRIPGSLHIINNALAQVTESLTHWQTFFAQLKVFEALWCYGRLQRYVNFCLRPSLLNHKCDEILKHKLGSLYTKRWGEVVFFCVRLVSVLPTLRSTWDERRFLSGVTGAEKNGGDDDGDDGRPSQQSNFDPSFLTATLRDHFFFAYFDMVLALVGMTEDIAQWSEACACHEDLLLRRSDPNRQAPMKRSRNKIVKSGTRSLCNLYSRKTETCPMRGKRLPELVAYGADKMLLDLGAAAIGSVFASHRHFLSNEQWHVLISDFEAGKSQAVLQFRLKFDWANRLPWKLALLAFKDQALARRDLRKAAAEFDEQPHEVQKDHHYITLKLLTQGSTLRSQFDLWLSGVSLQDPQVHDLEFEAACFRFVQITERLYEASHSILKRRTPPNASGPLISLQCRLLDIAAELQTSPQTLIAIASKYDITRDAKKLPIHLGLERHPMISPVLSKSWKLIKALNKVLYRADPIGQFPDVSHLNALNEKQKEQNKRKEKANAKRAGKIKNLPLAYHNLRACALHSHFVAVAESSAELLFSLPNQSEPGLQQERDLGLPLQGFNDVLAMAPPKADELQLLSDVPMSGSPQVGHLDFQPPSTESGCTYFRVINTKPSSRRLLSLNPGAAGMGGRLQSDDLAVCRFFEGPKFAPHDEEQKLWIGASSCLGHQKVEPVQILKHLPQYFTFEELSRDLRCLAPKSVGNSLLYSLPAGSSLTDASTIAECVTNLVQSEALPGTDSYVDLPTSNELQELLSQGFILCEETSGRYQLTHSGVNSLLTFRLHAPPTQVSAFMLTDSEPTVHMMLQDLEDQGWRWEILPSPKKRKREHECYTIGGDKIWRTSGLSVHKPYLQCLLDAERLQSQFGIQSIPHGCVQDVYVGLLKGEHFDPKPKSARLFLETDLPLPALSDIPASGDGANVEDIGLDADSDVEDVGGSVDRILELLYEGQEMQPPQREVCQSSAPAQASGSSGLGNAALPPPEASENPGRNLVAVSAEEASRGEYNWRTFKWGAFTFTSKRPPKSEAKSSANYVWQASCPFHAKNSKSGCRKSCKVSPLTPENFTNVINCLKAWCNEARKCQTQAEHIALSVSPDSYPVPGLIEAACIPASEKPSSKVKTDTEIMKEQQNEAKATSSSAPAPRALASSKVSTPKPSAKQASKSKPKAKPKAASSQAAEPAVVNSSDPVHARMNGAKSSSSSSSSSSSQCSASSSSDSDSSSSTGKSKSKDSDSSSSS